MADTHLAEQLGTIISADPQLVRALQAVKSADEAVQLLHAAAQARGIAADADSIRGAIRFAEPGTRELSDQELEKVSGGAGFNFGIFNGGLLITARCVTPLPMSNAGNLGVHTCVGAL